MGMPAGELISANAPDLRVPFRHIITAVIIFVLLTSLLFLGQGHIFSFYFRNPLALLATHATTLGWATMMIMGAAYQLVPVVLEVRLFSEKLAMSGYYLFTVGLVVLLAGFTWLHIPILVAGGTLVILGSYVFIYNLTRTLLLAPRWNVTATFLGAALFYFFLTITLGLILALNLQAGFIPSAVLRVVAVHAALGGMGWFTLAIMGVGYRLLPMFALVHRLPNLLAMPIFWLANLGIAGTAVALTAPGIAGAGVASLFVIALAAAVILFGVDVWRIVSRRQRARLGLTMRFSLAAVGYLVALAVGASVVLSTRLSFHGAATALPMGFAFLFLMGWVTAMIMGHLFKIVPFLVWLDRYSDKIGKQKVPLLREMVNERLGEWTFWLYNVGVIGAGISVLGGITTFRSLFLGVTAAASYLFAFNVLTVFRGPRQVTVREKG